MRERDRLLKLLKEHPATVEVLLESAGWVPYRIRETEKGSVRWWRKQVAFGSGRTWLTPRQALLEYAGVK